MAFLNETGLARLWEHILDKFDGLEPDEALTDEEIDEVCQSNLAAEGVEV